MSFIKDFKEFALKGNVIDLAVGVIIGAAFKTIVDSVVNDLIMPPVGLAIGNKDFSNYYLPLKQSVRDAVAKDPSLTLAEARKIGPVFAWGDFVTVCLNFLILAFIIFMMVRGIAALQRKQAEAPAAPAGPSSTDQLLMEIRDELKNKQ
ncbi:large conductance mechanosensitive channel protein MscL [Dinghuibacter silviterrae]|uniref:Large-conductance mechanosensitive channel n=1 Tax=Dinghuibacter silviterrae TaxID=1539049 RepID=A0A4R8DNV9_9BACT|nr:large conductance mechanosensitive channel protein MscL [Dinghuibacter silviterrae]TDW99405.1 large conductance mechanosensitive channel [Dinghuibacter silviterrae]